MFKSANLWAIKIATCLGFFVVQLDVSVVNVGLNALKGAFDTDLTGLQWVINSYSLPFSALLILGGGLTDAFKEDERVLLRFGKSILDNGKAPGVLFKHALRHFSVQDLSDAIIVIGYYRMISAHIQTFDIAIDAQEDGNWIKG